tara:strand:- start:135 stop:347 length:213 start_codon:yes stop_codon:yes gene_type:complete
MNYVQILKFKIEQQKDFLEMAIKNGVEIKCSLLSAENLHSPELIKAHILKAQKSNDSQLSALKIQLKELN